MISAYLRINKTEESELNKLSKEINMQRLQNNKKIVKESEILHMLIDFAFKNSEIKDGEIVIKNSFLQE